MLMNNRVCMTMHPVSPPSGLKRIHSSEMNLDDGACCSATHAGAKIIYESKVPANIARAPD